MSGQPSIRYDVGVALMVLGAAAGLTAGLAILVPAHIAFSIAVFVVGFVLWGSTVEEVDR